MNGLSAVTATAGVLSLVVALLIATVGRMVWPRVVAALVLTGVAGILNSTIGPAVRIGVGALDAQLGMFIGRWTGTAVMGVIGVVVFVIAAFRIVRRDIDMRTLAVTAAVPATVTLIPGMLGTIAVTVVGIVPWVAARILAFMFGLG